MSRKSTDASKPARFPELQKPEGAASSSRRWLRPARALLCSGASEHTYNDTQRENELMGSVLWATDLDIFAEQSPYGLGSHLDMRHERSRCVGIAWERDNGYWVFDGFHSAADAGGDRRVHGVGQRGVDRACAWARPPRMGSCGLRTRRCLSPITPNPRSCGQRSRCHRAPRWSGAQPSAARPPGA